ncbi:MAG: hypothetical protein ACFFCZ_07980 [Promethearchaeota archaeon]
MTPVKESPQRKSPLSDSLKTLLHLIRKNDVKTLKESLETLVNVISSESEVYESLLRLVREENVDIFSYTSDEFLNSFLEILRDKTNQEVLGYLLQLLHGEKPWIFYEIAKKVVSSVKSEPLFVLMFPYIKDQTLRREMVDLLPIDAMKEKQIQELILALVWDQDSWIQGRCLNLLAPRANDPTTRQVLEHLAQKEKDTWIRDQIQSILGKK